MYTNKKGRRKKGTEEAILVLEITNIIANTKISTNHTAS
jgi:hypothetical protein